MQAILDIYMHANTHTNCLCLSISLSVCLSGTETHTHTHTQRKTHLSFVDDGLLKDVQQSLLVSSCFDCGHPTPVPAHLLLYCTARLSDFMQPLDCFPRTQDSLADEVLVSLTLFLHMLAMEEWYRYLVLVSLWLFWNTLTMKPSDSDKNWPMQNSTKAEAPCGFCFLVAQHPSDMLEHVTFVREGPAWTIIIIIIAVKGAIPDLLQSPHCTANCLQHIPSSSLGVIVCKSRATHWALITCNMSCYMPRGTKGQLSYKVWQSWNRIYSSFILSAETINRSRGGGEETGVPGENPWRQASEFCVHTHWYKNSTSN